MQSQLANILGLITEIETLVLAEDKSVFTLDQHRNGKWLLVNRGSGVDLVIPPGLQKGFACVIFQMGAGAVTIAPDSGVTVNNVNSALTTSGQYAVATLFSYDDNIFVASGSLIP